MLKLIAMGYTTNTDINNFIGRRVLSLREEQGFSQRDLLLRLKECGFDINQSHLSRIEKSERQPSLDLLSGLADALETSTDYLLGRTDDDRAPSNLDDQVIATISDFGDRALVQETLDMMARANHEEKLYIADFVRRVVPRQAGNVQALRAVMNVMQRSLPPAVLAQFWTEFAVQFPSLAGVLDVSMPEQKRVNER